MRYLVQNKREWHAARHAPAAPRKFQQLGSLSFNFHTALRFQRFYHPWVGVLVLWHFPWLLARENHWQRQRGHEGAGAHLAALKVRIAVLEAEAVAAGRVTRARAAGGARPHAHAAVSVAMQAGGDAEGAQQAVEGVAGFGQQLGVVAAGGALFAR